MTDLFEEYVTRSLKRNGIPKNEEFETSDKRYGTLKWENGTMYETRNGTLGISDIAWILEESDIKSLYKFKEITQLEAMIELEAESPNIYRKLFNEFQPVRLVCGKKDIRTKTRCGFEDVHLIKFLDMKFYKKVKK